MGETSAHFPRANVDVVDSSRDVVDANVDAVDFERWVVDVGKINRKVRDGVVDKEGKATATPTDPIFPDEAVVREGRRFRLLGDRKLSLLESGDEDVLLM